MEPTASYVFLDLETTGLPAEECNKTRIIELSLIAVKRSHILGLKKGESPRVQHKLTLCFYPRRPVHPVSTEITGLCNNLLEHEAPFNKEAFDAINSFLSLLSKPVCLIGHNGLNFDFPILKKHLLDLGVSFCEELRCADCLHGFFDILDTEDTEIPTSSDVPHVEENILASVDVDEVDLICQANSLEAQKQNEATPKKSVSGINKLRPAKKKELLSRSGISKVSRRLFWGDSPKPKKSWKLKNIYERLLNRPCIQAHRAENDCLIALQCAVVVGEEFVQWVDENHCLFADVKPMTVGVRLGQ